MNVDMSKALAVFSENLPLAGLCALFFGILTVLLVLNTRTYWREHGRFMRFLWLANLVILFLFSLHILLTMMHLCIIPTVRGATACLWVTAVSGALLAVGNFIYGVVAAVGAFLDWLICDLFIG